MLVVTSSYFLPCLEILESYNQVLVHSDMTLYSHGDVKSHLHFLLKLCNKNSRHVLYHWKVDG